ncbi:MAG: M67 family metallopeptidase [Acidimicrobiales bacterium]
MSENVLQKVLAHCLDGAPLEACGLLGGRPGDRAVAERCYPARNAAGSARVYTLHPPDMLQADRDEEAAGGELIGVWHSHTHTDGRPSPTDVAEAPDPGWHYVLVSLRDVEPTLRSWRIVAGNIEEEPVVLE